MALSLSKQQQQQIGGGVFLVALAAAAYVYFFWLPISRKIDDLTAQKKDIEQKIAKAKAEASRLPRLQQDLEALSQEAADAERRLPKTKSVPDILNSLNAIGTKYGVSIQNFSPGTQKSQQYFIELYYPMTVHGSYHAVGRFLAALAMEERIFNVKDVAFPAPGPDGQMTVRFTLITYQYKG